MPLYAPITRNRPLTFSNQATPANTAEGQRPILRASNHFTERKSRRPRRPCNVLHRRPKAGRREPVVHVGSGLEMPDLSLQFGSQQTRRQTRSRDFKALLRGLDLLFQCMGLGTVSLHAQLPLWRERKSLSVTDSCRGRSGDEEKINILSANVGALVHTARHQGTPGRTVPSVPTGTRCACWSGRNPLQAKSVDLACSQHAWLAG
jgi:hypothetical protein